MRRLEIVLLQTLVFLIPTNLALHWYIDGAYINGHLVDYLLPRLYLSDLPAFLLILIFIFRTSRFPLRKDIYAYLLLPVYLLVRAVFTSLPLSSLWYSLKVIEYLLLGAYLTTIPLKRLLQRIIPPLLLAMVFQSILALYQFIHHSSLFGYLFLGEPDLKMSAIATTTWFGVLEVAPYGTTAHPNVLAGFLTVGILIYWLSTHISPIKMGKKAVNYTLIGLFSFIIILTQSLSALGSLLLSILALTVTKLTSSLNWRVIFKISAYSTLVVIPLLITLVYQSQYLLDNPSFIIRYELNQLALNLFKTTPFTGVGPNQFISYLPHTALAGQKTLFLQPPHNVLLLILSETGLIGVFLVALTIYILYRDKTPRLPASLAIQLPLFALIVIGALDHYPLTLQTGQLLLTFAAAISFRKS